MNPLINRVIGWWTRSLQRDMLRRMAEPNLFALISETHLIAKVIRAMARCGITVVHAAALRVPRSAAVRALKELSLT